MFIMNFIMDETDLKVFNDFLLQSKNFEDLTFCGCFIILYKTYNFHKNNYS